MAHQLNKHFTSFSLIALLFALHSHAMKRKLTSTALAKVATTFECSICFEDKTTLVRIEMPGCKQAICRSCTGQLQQPYCPFCQENIHELCPGIDSSQVFWSAVLRGDLQAVQKALLAGADLDFSNEEGWTPLHIAARNRHSQIVTALIQAGANKDAPQKDGLTPLHFAAANGHDTTVAELLNAGADPNIKEKNGWAPLHYASRKGKTDIVKLLLAHGADKDTQKDDGETPLHLAAANGHDTTVAELLNAGADPNIKEKENGWTPLHRASRAGKTDIVKLLLAHSADKDTLTHYGQTPFDLAFHNQDHATVVALLD